MFGKDGIADVDAFDMDEGVDNINVENGVGELDTLVSDVRADTVPLDCFFCL